MTQARTSGWTLVLASLGAFMTGLDTLVVASALPALQADLGATVDDLEWTVNAYNLAFAVCLLTGAALGERFGRKRVYTLGIAVFTAASVLAALAPDIGTLIAARGLQGVAAAAVMPASLTLISSAFPPHKRGAAIGIWGGISGLAVALGPVIGGAIVEGISWPWIFWLNVPIGVALVPAALATLTESRGSARSLDPIGMALAAASFAGLTWGLVRSSSEGWSDLVTLSALIGGSAVALAFFAWERRTPDPMLSLDLFTVRGFNAANGVGFFITAGLFGALFFMMQFLQVGLGYSPLEAGIRTLPWTGAPMLIAPLVGKLADRYGAKPFMVAGLALQAAGLGWIAAIAAPGMDYLDLALALGVAGLGISMCLPTVPTTAVTAVPPARMGIASGTSTAVRQLGGVFGIAVLATVFADPHAYDTPATFIDRFSDALWVGAALTLLGLIAAVRVPVRTTVSTGPNYQGAPA